MKLIRPFYQNIRYLRHNIHPDAHPKAIFIQPVPYLSRYIPQYQAVIPIFRFLADRFRAHTNVNIFRYLIFILSGGKLLQNVLHRTVTMHQQQISGRKNTSVNPCAAHRPQDNDRSFRQCHIEHGPDIQKSTHHQTHLQIRNGVYAHCGKHLRKHHLAIAQITDAHTAIHL